MKDDEKIFEAFRQAADHSPDARFPGMEKIWGRVEDKLDGRKLRAGISRWKKLAIAASILLMGSLGYMWVADKDRDQKVVISVPEAKPESKPLPTPRVPDSVRQIIIIEPQPAIVDAAPAPRIAPPSEAIVEIPAPSADVQQPPAQSEKTADDIVAVQEQESQVEIAVTEPRKVAPVKSEPLLIVDGKAVAGKNYSDRKNVSADEDTETVVLEEPLYIINGVEYSEQEMFGPNPTSPYAPLNRQEIESVKVLQGKEAIAAYGQKGSKGVLIIRTKNGKPASPARAKSR